MSAASRGSLLQDVPRLAAALTVESDHPGRQCQLAPLLEPHRAEGRTADLSFQAVVDAAARANFIPSSCTGQRGIGFTLGPTCTIAQASRQLIPCESLSANLEISL